MANDKLTMSEEKWTKKEARELFSKTVNTLLMNKSKSLDLDKILEIAKKVVDKAFENYPVEEKDTEKVNEELQLIAEEKLAKKEETPF